MSNVAENNDDDCRSDEDMFSPKKKRDSSFGTNVLPRQPGSKQRYVDIFKRLLTGIPPPPDYTNPDFHLDKILTLWRDNQNSVWIKGNCNPLLKKDNKSDLGICLNIDDSCEEFELLGQQVCDRYVWSETNATTSIPYIKLTLSAKKRRKANGWGLSPRTRISYLTRRMTTFQKDNIAAAVASNKTTQILLSKNERKTSGKVPAIKGKRALFQSPEHDNKFKTPEQGKNMRLCRKLVLTSSSLVDEGTVKNQGPARSSEKKRCSRSLFTNNIESNLSSVTTSHTCPLSTQHKQKMLWAVSNALKTVKIKMTDPNFKNVASQLFKATVEKWKKSISQSDDRKGSTSDTMLAMAKSLVEDITGRRMSPKSAKKSTKTKTPDKTIKRMPAELGIFPLENISSSKEEDLAPCGNQSISSFEFGSPSKRPVITFGPSIDESPDMESENDTIVSKKRKRNEYENERLTAEEPNSILTSPRILRSRTPSKPNTAIPMKSTGTTPNAKRRKRNPETPSNSISGSISHTEHSKTPRKVLFRDPIQPNATPISPIKGAPNSARKKSLNRKTTYELSSLDDMNNDKPPVLTMEVATRARRTSIDLLPPLLTREEISPSTNPTRILNEMTFPLGHISPKKNIARRKSCSALQTCISSSPIVSECLLKRSPSSYTDNQALTINIPQGHINTSFKTSSSFHTEFIVSKENQNSPQKKCPTPRKNSGAGKVIPAITNTPSPRKSISTKNVCQTKSKINEIPFAGITVTCDENTSLHNRYNSIRYEAKKRRLHP